MIRPVLHIKPGQPLLGVESKGLHLNGISLYRKIVFDVLQMKPQDLLPTRKSVAEEVLTRQPIYARIVLVLQDEPIIICGCSHITGGGLIDNIKRNLRSDCKVLIDKNSWEVPEIFRWLIEKGNVSLDDVWRTWNMGIGFVIIFPDDTTLEKAQKIIQEQFGLRSWKIGEVTAGNGPVEIV